MIPISRPALGEEELKAVKEVFASGVIAQGPRVSQFEQAFAEFVGTKYAVATNNGTTAIHTVLLACGIGRGDEVITPAFTFISPINCILLCGARPVFVDIGEDFNIDPDKIEEKITSKTRAIMPTHLYGQAADMEKIMDIAERHNLIVIEDACQAHGARFDGKSVGSFGTGFFSFYATKNITTGEGGMITTDSPSIAKKARLIRQHGAERRYYHKTVGYNYRMSDIQAAIGFIQLKKLKELNKKRAKNAEFFTENLKDIPDLITPKVWPKREHVWHAYTLRATGNLSRDKIVDGLNKNGIEALIYYPMPVYKQEVYKELDFNVSLPVTERLTKEIFSIPVHPGLGKDDLNKIVDTIKELV